MKFAKSAKTEIVRCLGPGKEHTFQSHDRVNERICKACREKLMSSGMMVRCRPVRSSISEEQLTR